MQKSSLLVLLFCFVIMGGCSNDDTVNPPPSTGEVLLAQVSGDSIGGPPIGGSKSSSITGQTLNFTDRDSARITFYYSGENNSDSLKFLIYYIGTTSPDSVIYNGAGLIPTTTEQFVNITIASPRVNQYFSYKITTTSLVGFSYFKFRDLKIYKK